MKPAKNFELYYVFYEFQILCFMPTILSSFIFCFMFYSKYAHKTSVFMNFAFIFHYE
jgi:hypothetical protein